MIIITKIKRPKKYQMPEIPNFENKRAKTIWLKRQKMLASIHNIKSVSVQVKDIKQMIYSKNLRLISFFAKFHLRPDVKLYSDDDYITILKSTNLNKSLIYALISTDWLLQLSTLENKSIEELQQDCTELQNKILELKERKKQIPNNTDIDYRIKLYEYKLLCLSEYVQTKGQSDLEQTTTRRVLLKDKKFK